MSRYTPLICLALMHTVVDTSALLIGPLWPELQRLFDWEMEALLLVFIVQSMPTSLSQIVFGYLRDRRATPHLLWLGPVLAAGFLTLVGVAPSTAMFCVLVVIGGVGVGAFHPEAAVAVGRMMPEQRTRALSVFMFGGSLGLALGPLLSGAVVSRWGLAGLAYLGPLLVLAVLLLWRVGRLSQVSAAPESQRATPGLREMLAGRWRLAFCLLIICSLRLVPNMAMDKVLSFTLDLDKQSTFEIGLIQSIFLISASVGMFLMALRFRSGLEKTFMVGCPLLGIPLLAALGSESCPRWLLLTLLVPTGIVLWGTTPAMVSYAQQQFPKGAGLASAITMGLSWGVGGLIQAPITAHFQELGTPQRAFHAFIPCLALAAVGAFFLPALGDATTSQSADDPFENISDAQAEPIDA